MQIDEEEGGFKELGIAISSCKILKDKSVLEPTAIQSTAIPLIVNSKDVVVPAGAGSGKRLPYLIPVLESLLDSFERDPFVSVPMLIIIVPKFELAEQLYEDMKPFIEVLSIQEREPVVSVLKSPILSDEWRDLMKKVPDMVVSTVNCVLPCLEQGFLKTRTDKSSLCCLFIDEIHDLMLNHSEDLKSLMDHVPESCNRLFFSANPRCDVDKMKAFLPRNPYVIALEEGNVSVAVNPLNAEQYYILCQEQLRIHYILPLLRVLWFGQKVVIFTESTSRSILLHYILNQENVWRLMAEYRASALHAHALELFGKGEIDWLIVDDSFGRLTESELSAIKLKNLDMVVHFEMPETVAGYVGRLQHIIKINNTVTSYSLISPKDEGLLKDIKSYFETYGCENGNMLPYPSNWRVKEVYDGRVQYYLKRFETLEIEDIEAFDIEDVEL